MQQSQSPKALPARLVFLFPQLELNDGGHIAQRRFQALAAAATESVIATYALREQGAAFLDDLLEQPAQQDSATYCIHYGPHIKRLVKKLKGRRVVYFAHSTGWAFDLPAGIPIVSVSRHSQAYWGRKAPSNPGFCLPNIIGSEFALHDCSVSAHQRPVDVLVVKRKMSPYLLNSLVPTLKQYCSVKVVDGWVDDLAREYKSAKVFLYDSADYWKRRGVSEGFGLPPLEARASGCTVFSSLNDALSDYLQPGVNCAQFTGDVAYDCERILAELKDWCVDSQLEDCAAAYRQPAVAATMASVFAQIEQYFNYAFKPKSTEITLRDRLAGMIERTLTRVAALKAL